MLEIVLFLGRGHQEQGTCFRGCMPFGGGEDTKWLLSWNRLEDCRSSAVLPSAKHSLSSHSQLFPIGFGCNPNPIYSEISPIIFNGAYSNESVFRIAAPTCSSVGPDLVDLVRCHQPKRSNSQRGSWTKHKQKAGRPCLRLQLAGLSFKSEASQSLVGISGKTLNRNHNC